MKKISDLSKRKQVFSKLGKVMAMIAIIAVCLTGLLKYAWASDFTEELAKARLEGKASFVEKTTEMAEPAPMISDILGTNTVAQICIVVHDIEKTAKVYGDFFGLRYRITESVPYEIAKTRQHGKPSLARCKMAFFNFDNIQLELIQPDEHPSSWREHLDKYGEGFHHLAFNVKGTEDVLKRLESIGMKTQMTGNWATGCFAYVDATDQLKMLIETLENGYLFERE